MLIRNNSKGRKGVSIKFSLNWDSRTILFTVWSWDYENNIYTKDNFSDFGTAIDAYEKCEKRLGLNKEVTV